MSGSLEETANAPPDLEHVRQELAALLPALRRRRHVCEIAVFGSVARGEAGPASDIDLLVTFGPEASLFDFVEPEEELSARFGRRVQATTPGSLRPAMREQVQSEAVPV